MDLSGQELVRLAAEKLGVAPDDYSDIAKAIGLGLHGDRRVKRWMRERNEPDFEGTMLLLRYTGMLRSLDEIEEAPVSVPGRQPSLEAEVAAIREELSQALSLLNALLQRSG